MTSGENAFPLAGKTFPQRRNIVSRDEFRARISAALSKRLFPNTGLHKVDLAHALGVVPKTLVHWIDRYSQPDGYLLAQLIAFFDAGFANEVFGDTCVVAKLDDMRRFVSLKQVNRTAPALAAIERVLNEVA